MKTITTEELIKFKILPFNLYSEYGEQIFAAGEVLTPGKLLQLKQMSIIYRDDQNSLDIVQEEEKKEEEKQEEETVVDTFVEKTDVIQETFNEENSNKSELDIIFEEYEKIAESKERVVEHFDMNPNQTLKSNTVVDDVSIMNYKGPINKKSKIDPQNQIKLKAIFNETINGIGKRPNDETANLFLNIRDKILQDIIFRLTSVNYSSQLELIGEYQKCHSLNVAIMAGFIAQKMNYTETAISDVVLSGLMHDIGKTRIDPDIAYKQNLNNQEQQMIQLHTTIGYRMLKEDFEMPENIALVALEHHENNDGSGYPMNKSGDQISDISKIIHICNYYDNLCFNRTNCLIRNSKDALRRLLELGTKSFIPDALYTFIHMFSYNDVTNFEDMIL